MRDRVGKLMAAIALVAAGCAHTSSKPAAPDREPTASDTRVEREASAERPQRPSTMGSSRVYDKDELDSAGDSGLGHALWRLGHEPR